MPIYDYRCTKCKHEHDVIVKISEADTYVPEPQCDCEAPELQRFIPSKGAASFVATPMYRRHGKKGSWGG